MQLFLKAHSSDRWAWLCLAVAFALISVWVSTWVNQAAPSSVSWLHQLDWEGSQARLQPWRIFTSAWVHWSPQHLVMNVAGAAGVGALGVAAALPRAAALAWFLAWPLGQLLMGLAAPMPAHVAGLSGVLHAGAAVAAVWLLVTRHGPPRMMGVLLALSLVAKLVWETAAGPQPIAGGNALTWPPTHIAGSLAGAITAGLLLAMRGSR